MAKGAIAIMNARAHVPGPTSEVGAFARGHLATNMDLCRPGWDGNGYKSSMPGKDEFQITCMQPLIGALDQPIDTQLFASEAQPRAPSVCNMPLAERLSAPYYF